MGWIDKLVGTRAPGSLGPSTVAQAIADIAAHHCLDGDDKRVSGEVLGFEVGIEREILEWTGGGGHMAERLLMRVALPKPVDLGLSVRMAADSDPRKPFATGDAAFDARYVCTADEPERGRAMLTDAVRALMADGPETELGDGGVTVAVGVADAHRLGEALGYALDLTRALDEARPAVRGAIGLAEARTAWSAAAADMGLSFETTPLSVGGKLYGVPGDARAVRDSFSQYHFALRAAFVRPLYVGLMIKPHSFTHEHGREADPLGDPAFDRVFVATAKSTPVLPLFDADVRQRLLGLRDAGLQIRGDDRALTAWLGFKKEELEVSVRLLAPLCDIAAAIVKRVEAAKPSLPGR